MLQLHHWRNGRLSTRHVQHAHGSRGVSAWEALAGATREAMTAATAQLISEMREAKTARAFAPVTLGNPEDY